LLPRSLPPSRCCRCESGGVRLGCSSRILRPPPALTKAQGKLERLQEQQGRKTE